MHEHHQGDHEQQHTEQHDQRWAAQEEVHEEEVHEEDPYGDPYGAVWDEEEDEDEEVEYPGGADFGAGLERAPDGVKRPPFAIKKWHDEHKAYLDPEGEKEYKDTEEAHLRESFSVGRMHGIQFGLHDDHRDDEHQIKMTAGGILAYFMAALNPDSVDLHPDEVRKRMPLRTPLGPTHRAHHRHPRGPALNHLHRTRTHTHMHVQTPTPTRPHPRPRPHSSDTAGEHD